MIRWWSCNLLNCVIKLDLLKIWKIISLPYIKSLAGVLKEPYRLLKTRLHLSTMNMWWRTDHQCIARICFAIDLTRMTPQKSVTIRNSGIEMQLTAYMIVNLVCARSLAIEESRCLKPLWRSLITNPLFPVVSPFLSAQRIVPNKLWFKDQF